MNLPKSVDDTRREPASKRTRGARKGIRRALWRQTSPGADRPAGRPRLLKFPATYAGTRLTQGLVF
jgi:hypothetical protein